MESGYASGLRDFMKRKWVALPILMVTMAMIYLFGKNLQSELAP